MQFEDIYTGSRVMNIESKNYRAKLYSFMQNSGFLTKLMEIYASHGSGPHPMDNGVMESSRNNWCS